MSRFIYLDPFLLCKRRCYCNIIGGLGIEVTVGVNKFGPCKTGAVYKPDIFETEIPFLPLKVGIVAVDFKRVGLGEITVFKGNVVRYGTFKQINI